MIEAFFFAVGESCRCGESPTQSACTMLRFYMSIRSNKPIIWRCRCGHAWHCHWSNHWSNLRRDGTEHFRDPPAKMELHFRDPPAEMVMLLPTDAVLIVEHDAKTPAEVGDERSSPVRENHLDRLCQGR